MRGRIKDRIWIIQPVHVVQDTGDEIATLLMPGSRYMAFDGYQSASPRIHRKWLYRAATEANASPHSDTDWTLEPFTWKQNRFLITTMPGRCYSIYHIWEHETDAFKCFYVNFESPAQRTAGGLDLLDWDLDVIIKPDLSWELKDEEEYRYAVEVGGITQAEKEMVKRGLDEVLNNIVQKQYPFDGRWLDWRPEVGRKPADLKPGWEHF